MMVGCSRGTCNSSFIVYCHAQNFIYRLVKAEGNREVWYQLKTGCKHGGS